MAVFYILLEYHSFQVAEKWSGNSGPDIANPFVHPISMALRLFPENFHKNMINML